MCIFLVSLSRTILDQVNWLARNASVMIPKFSVNFGVDCTLCENKLTSDSVHIAGKCNSIVLEQNLVQGTLTALLVTASPAEWRTQLTLKSNRFGLVLIPRFPLSAVLGLCFCCVFWNCGLALLKCCFLVGLCTAIVDQVCRVHEMLPFIIPKWTVMYTVPDGKINLVRTQLTFWENAVRLLSNKIL